ncbi:MAG: tetratricopeptide repeat protein [Planctomycetaceae bacterium]|nr:tetratricopeptide repeat protein [Planctomycetaceae bacterium]
MINFSFFSLTVNLQPELNGVFKSLRENINKLIRLSSRNLNRLSDAKIRTVCKERSDSCKNALDEIVKLSMENFKDSLLTGNTDIATSEIRFLLALRPLDPMVHLLHGAFHHQKGFLESAMEAYKEAERLSEDGSVTKALSLKYQGEIHALKKEHSAEILLKKAQKLFNKLGLKKEEALCDFELANIQLSQGNYISAEQVYTHLMKQQVVKEDDRFNSIVLGNYGNTLYRMGNFKEAEEVLLRSVKINKTIKRHRGSLAADYSSLGELYFLAHRSGQDIKLSKRKAGLLKASYDYHSQALDLDSELNNYSGVYEDYCNLAKVCHEMGDDDGYQRNNRLAHETIRKHGYELSYRL